MYGVIEKSHELKNLRFSISFRESSFMHFKIDVAHAFVSTEAITLCEPVEQCNKFNAEACMVTV